MSAFFSSMGNLGEGMGTAYKEQLAYNLAKQQSESNIAHERAQEDIARQQTGLQQKEFEAGKWYLDKDSFAMPDGTPAPVMFNRITGEQRIPKGAISTKSLAFQFNNLRNALPPADQAAFDQMDFQTKIMLLQKLNPYSGLSPVTYMGPNGPQQGMLAKGSNTVQPSQMAGGGPVQKPTPIGMATAKDAQGNDVLVPYSKVGGPHSAATPQQPANGAVPQAAPQAASPQGQGQPTSPSGSVATSNGHMIKNFPKISAEGGKVLESVRSAAPMLEQLSQVLQANPERLKNGSFNSIRERASSAVDWAKYQGGLPIDDPVHAAAFPLADLYRNLITGVYLHGIRRGDLINQIRAHMPAPTDTPALMAQKVAFLQQMNPQIEQAIIDFERQRALGVNAITVTPSGNNATSAPPRTAEEFLKKHAPTSPR